MTEFTSWELPFLGLVLVCSDDVVQGELTADAGNFQEERSSLGRVRSPRSGEN